MSDGRVKPGWNNHQGWGDLPPLTFPPLLADPPRVRRFAVPGPLTVMCVCVGPKFPLHYVERLRNMVARNLDHPHRFMCISDRYDVSHLLGAENVVAPGRDLPGWYSKINLFSPDLPLAPGERVLYFDLDVVITGSLNGFAEAQEGFCMIREFNAKPQAAHNSSVMAWDAGGYATEIYAGFGDDWTRRSWGDQECIWKIMGNDRIWNWPDAWVKSYKYHARGAAPPANCSVMVFHGDPKPDAVGDAWVKAQWK